jgi:hypothetical protein
VLCFCFVCSVLLPVSLDFSFLIAPSVFFDIYCECCTYLYHALVIIAIPNSFDRIVRRLIFDRSKLPLCDIIVHMGHDVWLKYRWSEVNIETIWWCYSSKSRSKNSSNCKMSENALLS